MNHLVAVVAVVGGLVVIVLGLYLMAAARRLIGTLERLEERIAPVAEEASRAMRQVGAASEELRHQLVRTGTVVGMLEVMLGKLELAAAAASLLKPSAAAVGGVIGAVGRILHRHSQGESRERDSKAE